jgi:hypothetical protein
MPIDSVQQVRGIISFLLRRTEGKDGISFPDHSLYNCFCNTALLYNKKTVVSLPFWRLGA